MRQACASADAPLDRLPDLRLLPTTVQRMIYSYSALPQQAVLAHSFSCFRPCWHQIHKISKAYADGKTCEPETTACKLWHKHQMTLSAASLSNSITAEIWKRRVHRGPGLLGGEVHHCKVHGHFVQKQLAYVLQLPLPSVAVLGGMVCKHVFSSAVWPGYEGEHDNRPFTLFLTFRLSCRRQVGLSDDQLEHLEAMFRMMPSSMVRWANEEMDPWLACAPMWHCIIPPRLPIGMCWDAHISDDGIECTMDEADFLL